MLEGCIGWRSLVSGHQSKPEPGVMTDQRLDAPRSVGSIAPRNLVEITPLDITRAVTNLNRQLLAVAGPVDLYPQRITVFLTEIQFLRQLKITPGPAINTVGPISNFLTMVYG